MQDISRDVVHYGCCTLVVYLCNALIQGMKSSFEFSSNSRVKVQKNIVYPSGSFASPKICQPESSTVQQPSCPSVPFDLINTN